MEYTLEGHGYCRSRALRDLPSWKELPIERRMRLDAHLEQLALHPGGAGWAGPVEPPADLMPALQVRAPSSPRWALALDVATSVKEVFDGLARSLELRITHCTLGDGPADGAHLVLGAWSPTLTAEVARGDTVAAGVLIALHGDALHGNPARVEVLSRIFRKVCENGAVVHESDEPALELAPHWPGESPRLRDEIARRITAALDPVLFATDVEHVRAGAVEALDHRGGALGAQVRQALTHDRWEAVMRRYHADTWTRWGLANAVTAEARWSLTFAEARRLERLGGALARSGARPAGSHPPPLAGPEGGAAPIETPIEAPATEAASAKVRAS